MATILVVDDVQASLLFAQGLLEALGFDTLLAKAGQAALALCERSMPDGILMDWEMPCMDGPECMKRIRALPNGAQAKVIFCTIRDEYEDVVEAMSSGADAFMMKPYTLDTLKYFLRKADLLDDMRGALS